jgi:hypothetical protein
MRGQIYVVQSTEKHYSVCKTNNSGNDVRIDTRARNKGRNVIGYWQKGNALNGI